MNSPPDDDPYDPSDQEIAKLTRLFGKMMKLKTDSDASYTKRRTKRGLTRAKAGIWNDHPDGSPIWKASIAGIAVAYQEVSGDKGHAIDLVAEAAGLSNNTKGIDVSSISENTHGLADRGRAYVPGDSGKNVSRFVSETLGSKNPLVQAEFDRAKDGDLLFEKLDSFQTYVGNYGPLKRPHILQAIKLKKGLNLRQAVGRARATGKRVDRDVACDKLLLAAEAMAVARYLFHRKGRPRSMS